MASMEWDPTEYLKSTAVSVPKAVDAVETLAGMRWKYAAHAPDVEDMPRSWLTWGAYDLPEIPRRMGYTPRYSHRLRRVE